MLLVLISVIFLDLCHLCQNVNVEAFCAIKCANEADKHTVCKYRCEEDPARCTEFKHQPLNDRARQDILDLHNKYRNKVASGEATEGGNQPAKDMIALNYDIDIEVTTYCLGKRCHFQHDKCRRLEKYPSAGQNLFLQKGTLPIDGERPDFLRITVKQWYEEINLTNKNVLAKYAKTAKFGHFTQLVWAKTEFIGCSRVTWTNEGASDEFKFMFEFLCNYSPSGNVIDMPVYEFGTGCTPPRSANDRYPALCGESKRLAKDENEESDEEENDDEETPPEYNEQSGGRPNVTGMPWELNASQINRGSAVLPWICLLSYMNGGLYRFTTVY